MQRATGICAAVTLASLAASLPAWSAEPPPPLYPQIVVPTDASFSDDKELSAFRQAAIAAADARADHGQGLVLDPTVVVALMADEVEFFVGPGKGLSGNAFRSLGFHTPEKALEMLGSLSERDAPSDPLVRQRYALYRLKRMVADPTVGRTPWLDGRICTASYGTVRWPDWMALHAAAGMRDRDWVIVAAVDPSAMEGALNVPPDWPTLHQLVPVATEQKAAAGWLGLIAPNGETVFFRAGFEPEAMFAPYLNDHVCFEQDAAGDWKISAIAKRLD